MALDISEVFKPVIVDRVIFNLINNRLIKPEHFHEEVKRRFEWLLDYFHLNAGDVLTAFVEKWVEENESQAKLDGFIKAEGGATINIIQPAQVNLNFEQKFEISMVKQDLQAALELASRKPEDWQFQRGLMKQAIKASRLYERTRDPELEALIRQVEEML